MFSSVGAAIQACEWKSFRRGQKENMLSEVWINDIKSVVNSPPSSLSLPLSHISALY